MARNAHLRRTARSAASGVVLVGVSVFMAGCINVVPSWRSGPTESSEAAALARVLRRLQPEAKDLLLSERGVANQIKITLEETATADPVAFGSKLETYQSSLIEIRTGLLQLRETIRQGVYSGPLVLAVQRDAMRSIEDAVLRTERWVQAARNVKFRTDLGEKKNFPEVAVIGKELDLFLSQVMEEPLVAQMHALQAEFHVKEGD